MSVYYLLRYNHVSHGHVIVLNMDIILSNFCILMNINIKFAYCFSVYIILNTQMLKSRLHAMNVVEYVVVTLVCLLIFNLICVDKQFCYTFCFFSLLIRNRTGDLQMKCTEAYVSSQYLHFDRFENKQQEFYLNEPESV